TRWPRSIMPASPRTSPSSRPRAGHFSNGWKGVRFRALPLSNSNKGTKMNQSEMTAKMERGDGFIAALDQSGGSTPKALKAYGIEEGAWSNDEQMFDLIHKVRERIITSPCFGSGKVIGAILFERTMDGSVAGKPTPQALIDQGVVPFIKIDKGLEAEANGVQL